MTLLLDTHVLLWLLSEPGRLSRATCDAIADEQTPVFVSIVSLWEVTFKVRLGKLEAELGAIRSALAPNSKLQLLGLETTHLACLAALPRFAEHRDPFDHLLLAQASAEEMIFVTNGRFAPLYGVSLMAP